MTTVIPSARRLRDMREYGCEIHRIDETTVSVNAIRFSEILVDGIPRLARYNSVDVANSYIQRCFTAWLAIGEDTATRRWQRRARVLGGSPRLGMAILASIHAIGCYDGVKHFQFKDILYHVALALGADDDASALDGKCYHPYAGTRWTKNHLCGQVASWIEERSPHSRQRYWRGNKRITWTELQRPLLFTNPGLGEANDAVEWRPYEHVRGKGWYLHPDDAARWYSEKRPSDKTLDLADKVLDNPPPKKDGTLRIPRRGGMRGSRTRHALASAPSR